MRIAFGLGLLLIAFLVVGALVVWVWALVDAIRTPDGAFQTGNQLVWVLVILFGNLIGAILYLAIGRAGRDQRPWAGS